ncbi:MAG: FAD-dependent oxidoreductase [Dehalococcoidales bacterium]|nr:FAD-dependent oxidoreductase [Dehalococcoidales bacterium]
MAEISSDIVVVGGGTSGMAAAVAAAEKGTSVTVVEKAATTGGTGNMGIGLFAVESKMQKERNINLTRGEAFRILMTYNHWKADARLAKKYIDKSASTIDWLQGMGVKFANVISTDPGAYMTDHEISSPEGYVGPQSSANMIKCLTVKARDLGVKMFLRTTVKSILKSQNQVIGVLAYNNNTEEELRVNSKALIISTGGFGDNPEWIKKYTGFNWGRDMLSFRIPGCTGDGIRLAWEAGAGASEMIMHMIYVCTEGLGETTQEVDLTIASRQPNLVVNLLGERFFNEEMMDNNTFTGNAIAVQKDRTVFNIIDKATKDHYEQEGLDLVYGVMPKTKIESLEAIMKKMINQGKDIVYIADSLEQLAEQTDIDYEGLVNTVEEYNKACETGCDEIFEKSPKYLCRPVIQPPFYAFKLRPGAYGTLGGIKVNHKLEVLTKNYEVIPGLYATGTDANNLYGDSYCFILPGHTMGFAVNSGRMAGENASEFVNRF